MAVKMRLTRLGDKKSPFYRIVITDSRNARDGAYIDKVGHYNPTTVPAEVVIDADKAKDWIQKGVQPTATVKNLLIKLTYSPNTYYIKKYKFQERKYEICKKYK